MVWKDYAAEKIESDRQVRERLKFVVSSKKTEADSEARGIQSLYNSSATDCALYSMFALNDTFDYVFRDPKARYNDPVSVVRILKDYVVTPLRRIGFVGAKRTIALKLAMQRAAELDMVSVIGELSKFISLIFHSDFSLPCLLLFRTTFFNNCLKLLALWSSDVVLRMCRRE